LYPAVSDFESGVLLTVPLAFLARSRIRQKLPYCPSFRPPARPHVSTRISLDEFFILYSCEKKVKDV
jgi:hypothetical protein